MMTRSRALSRTALLLGVMAADFGGASEAISGDVRTDFAFVTYVGSPAQEKDVAMLVDGIRAFGGEYRRCIVYAVITDPELKADRLSGKEVELLKLDVSDAIRRYPYAVKAFAAAMVEDRVEKDVRSLAWFDPETLLLGPPRKLDLRGRQAVALRPVFLINTIGQAPDAALDSFWTTIYSQTSVDPKQVPVVEPFAEPGAIRAYYNCGIISVQPSRRIFREWARVLDGLLQDSEFQRVSCPDSLHRIFLHQAVLSAVILARLKRSEIRTLPPEYVYPLHLHDRVPSARRARRLDSVIGLVHEEIWNERKDWMDILPASASLKKWLMDAYTGG